MQPEFTEAFIMSTSPSKNKDQFKDILRYYLEDNLDSIQHLPKNTEWLSQNEISHDIFARREREFMITEAEKTTDNSGSI